MPTAKVVCAIAFCSLMLIGCAAQPGKKVLTYSEQTTELPKPMTVRQAGSYGLYPEDGITPIATIALEPGQTIGFRHASDGTVVGFADGNEYKLTAVLASDYSWKYLGKSTGK